MTVQKYPDFFQATCFTNYFFFVTLWHIDRAQDIPQRLSNIFHN